MIRTYISPNFTQEKFDDPTCDDLIDVFEDRIRNWVIEPAKRLMSDDIYQVAGFSVVLTYFEGTWAYVQGQDSEHKSRSFFVDAFVDVFRPSGLSEDVLRGVADVLYRDARCGFFHDAVFRDRIYFKRLDKGEFYVTKSKKGIESIVIDSQRFCNAVERHFAQLIAVLRNPSSIGQRAKFEIICKAQWDYDGPGRVVGFPNPPEDVM
jgi:hypothetical protein